jgi:hypothetical protein
VDSAAPGITRRGLLGSALALEVQRAHRARARGSLYAQSEIARVLQSPLTLGIARVVLRPGAMSQSTTRGDAHHRGRVRRDADLLVLSVLAA